MRVQREGRLGALEVLVALFAVGLLVSLLLPALQVSGGPSRRSTCQNNMRQLTMGLLQVQKMQGEFLGYANAIGGKRASWIVPILPQLERSDLYRNWMREDFPPNWQTRGFGDAKTAFYCPIDVLICPSQYDLASQTDNPLSYVANSGSARTANDFCPAVAAKYPWVEDLASGIFFNRARADFSTAIAQPSSRPPADAFAPRSGPVMTAQYIAQHDGQTYTVLLSENLQPGNWASDPFAPAEPMQSEFQMRANTCFVWFVTGQVDNRLPVSATVTGEKGFDASLLGINRRKDLQRPLPVEFRYDRTSNYGGLAAARPASSHSRGVNVSYCGGNAGYLSEDIDYRVFTQLMTPNGQEVVVDIAAEGEPIRANAARGTSARVETPWQYELDEREF